MWQLWAVFFMGMMTSDTDHSTWTAVHFCKTQVQCEADAAVLAQSPNLIQTWIRTPDGEKTEMSFYQ